MVLKYDYNVKKLVGAKAVVVRPGQVFTTYEDFADGVGYPEAVDQGRGYEMELGGLKGTEVYVHAKGTHTNGRDIVCVCETRHGEQFLINEKGLTYIEEGKVMGEVQTKLIDIKTDDLYKEIERRAFEAGYAEGKKAGVSSVTAVGVGIVEPKEESAEIARDEVVSRAKADIEGLSKYETYLDMNTYVLPGRLHTVAEFVVNREKRTVVALMKGAQTGKLRAKGVAKCDPSDCFNEHIGKAIALRRALGLDVPDEYLNAPAPKGVRVGDVVRGRHTGRVGDIDRVGEGEWGYGKYRNGDGLYVPSHHVDVIDDTARYQ